MRFREMLASRSTNLALGRVYISAAKEKSFLRGRCERRGGEEARSLSRILKTPIARSRVRRSRNPSYDSVSSGPRGWDEKWGGCRSTDQEIRLLRVALRLLERVLSLERVLPKALRDGTVAELRGDRTWLPGTKRAIVLKSVILNGDGHVTV